MVRQFIKELGKDSIGKQTMDDIEGGTVRVNLVTDIVSHFNYADYKLAGRIDPQEEDGIRRSIERRKQYIDDFVAIAFRLADAVIARLDEENPPKVEKLPPELTIGQAFTPYGGSQGLLNTVSPPENDERPRTTRPRRGD